MVPGKKWNGGHNFSAKGCENKGGNYTSTYAPGADSNKNTKDKGETPTVIVYDGQINETATILLPTEEEWSQNTAEDHDLKYIKRILSGLEETPVDPKELSKKGYVKPFQKGCLEMENGLLFYYTNPLIDRVVQLSLRVVPIKFI